MPVALPYVKSELRKNGAINMNLRTGSGKVGPVITDNGNFILDVFFNQTLLSDAHLLHSLVKGICGIVETGIFLPAIIGRVFVAESTGYVSMYENNL